MKNRQIQPGPAPPATADPVVSEVEEVAELVAVCVAISVETWAGLALEDGSSLAGWGRILLDMATP